MSDAQERPNLSQESQLQGRESVRRAPDVSESIATILIGRVQEKARPIVRFGRHVVAKVTNVSGTTESTQTGSGSAFVVTVLSGRHAGASARLHRRAFSIGSDFSCDVIITDAEIAASHLDVAPQRGLLGAIAVTAQGPDVTVAGEALEVGGTVSAYLPASISVGDVRLRISANGAAEAGNTINWRPVAGAVALGVLAALLWPAMSSFTRSVMAGVTGAIGEVDTMIAGSDKRALNDVTAKLSQAGLGPDITVAAHGEGLIARGVVSAAKHTQWSVVKRELAGKGITLVDQVHTSSSSEPSRSLIAAISLGEPPYVVTAGGRKVRIGEALDGGWIVKELRSNAVVVERGAVNTTIVP